MNCIGRAVVVLILAALGLAVSVAAQTNRLTGVELLRVALERTDQMIERSDPVIKATGNQIAITTLERAMNLQRLAHEEFNKETLAGYASARKLTLLAREQLLLAFKVIGGNRGTAEQQDDFVLRKIEWAEEVLDRAMEAISGSENRAVEAVAEAARNNLDRAWEFYRNKQYRPALKLAEQVEKSSERILIISGRADQGKADFERRVENTKQLIEQVREQLADCDSEAGHKFLAEAERSLRSALEMRDRQRGGASLQALLRARELALKAGRECHGLERLQVRRDHLQVRLDRVKSGSLQLQGQSAEAFRTLLTRAEEQLGLAQQHIDEGDWRAAAVALQAAQIAIRQAEEMMQQAG